MTMNNTTNVINDIMLDKIENKFKLFYDYSIKDSIYDDEPFYDDDYYILYYNDEELLIYDEDEYPSDIEVVICKIQKRITVFVPYIEDTFRNSEIAKQGIEYIKEYIYKTYNENEYFIEVYYSSK